MTLPLWRAQLIAIDLLLYDEVDSLFKLQSEEIGLLRIDLEIKYDYIAAQQEEIDRLNQIISLNGQQLTAQEKISNTWEKRFRRERRQKFMIGGVSLGIIGLVAALAL